MQEIIFILIACVIASISGQYMSPYHYGGMGAGMVSPMGRLPGLMQTSHVSSMSYPTYRMHPLFRLASAVSSADKNTGVASAPQDVYNVPKVPSAQEILTHMVLASQNPKPYYDTMADLLYDPLKTRQAILTPVYLQGIKGMNTMRANNLDDCGPDTDRWEQRMNEWVY